MFPWPNYCREKKLLLLENDLHALKHDERKIILPITILLSTSAIIRTASRKNLKWEALKEKKRSLYHAESVLELDHYFHFKKCPWRKRILSNFWNFTEVRFGWGYCIVVGVKKNIILYFAFINLKLIFGHNPIINFNKICQKLLKQLLHIQILHHCHTLIH